ncbi:queuosine precursor transporter [Legionella saoudiensis]|uniref:queuosine precursor transporter n=1 Tax=Legionella saoudiensis TaxID=1750561 RepID=UPI0018C1F706|nr:queuosine precursor transporter [Legionella saoudiensis]
MNNQLLNKLIHEDQNLKYFYILSNLYIFGILTSLTVSARLLPFHIPFTNYNIVLSGGTWIIPFTFFIQDITTEVYGCNKSNGIVLLSVPIIVAYILYLKITTFFPLPNTPNIVASYNEVFNSLPRHLVALLAALSAGILVNNFILSKLKTRFKGKYLPIRFIIATTVGEASLQMIGTTIAWFGTLSFTTEILPFILFSFFYKVSFEAILTPANIFLCRWLKKAEGIDIYNN